MHGWFTGPTGMSGFLKNSSNNLGVRAVTPEDNATIFCYGLCLLALVLVLGGLFLESRALKKKAEEQQTSSKDKADVS